VGIASDIPVRTGLKRRGSRGVAGYVQAGSIRPMAHKPCIRAKLLIALPAEGSIPLRYTRASACLSCGPGSAG
ncbi:MAG TPA: hypothetical protein VK463_11415, partial [Desulfomonilaceae bacterium]|nr:hypothetical protein [Desulfomonilaceae bacterium]